jgi:hypothetical protein
LKGKFISIIFFLILYSNLQAQQVTIKGKVTDAETGEGLPYVVLSIYKTSFGTETDEEGNYSFQATLHKDDSINVNYIGYKRIRQPIQGEVSPIEINFQLEEENTMMKEFVVRYEENPAFAIMRKVIKNKNINDPRKINAFRYDNYSRMELGIDNFGTRLQKKRFMRAVEKELAKDSMKLERGMDGKPIMPVFFSETISKVYRNREGSKSKEEIIAVKNNNIGLVNGKLIKPMLYSTYQESNFYANQINILQTDFQSPLADGWQLLYKYELDDTVYIDGDKCFQINVQPKNPRDLAFTGTIWIADSTYALKQLQLYTNQKTKLNFVESIKIFQMNRITTEKCWMPAKTKIELDLSNITHWKLGVIARLTTYANNVVVNDPMPDKFFKEGLVENEDAFIRGREMDSLRKDSLTAHERNFTNSIHTIREVKPIKKYVKLINLLTTGYWNTGKINVGYLLSLYNNNNIEGIRTSLSLQTNSSFSRRFIFKGSGAYGFKDEIFKYAGSVDIILDRHPWTLVGFEHRYDMDQLGVNAEQLANNQIFYAFTRNGTMRGPYYNTSDNLYFQTDLRKSLTQRITFRYKDFNPAYPFAYYSNETDLNSPQANKFTTSEIILDTRWAKDEFKFIDGNNRLSLGAKKWPIVNLRNVIGLKDVFNSHFNYYKCNISFSHNFPMGILGRTFYDINAGKIFGTVPYPILETHIGNQSAFYSNAAFNLMDYFEFISDTYASLRYRHYFGGLFFNRIPLIKRFKWGCFVTTNLAFGSMSTKNYNMTPPTDLAGNNLRTFSTLNKKPYWEVGYGIDNIFKCLRVDLVHRLTYREGPDVRKFGVKISFQLSL